MADLSPDTSIYAPFARQSQPLDLNSLMGLIAKSRQLNTQSSIANAIRANPNDPSAAYNAAASDPNVYMGPGDLSSFVHAQRAKSELGQWYMGQAGQAVSSLLTKPNATLNDWHPIRLMLEGYGVPPSVLDQVEAGVTSGGQLDKRKLVTLQQWISANGGLPTVPTIDPNTGQPTQKPIGQIMHEQAGGGGGGGAAPPGAANAPSAGGSVGGYPTDLPPQQASTRKEAGDAQASLQHYRAVDLPQNRQMLSQLSDLSHEAATGPGANWQVNWSKLMNNLGMPQFANLTPQEVSSSENFKKIAERLVSQMANAGGHVTNDFLHNAYGSNPSLEISRQGREGMISWLQGMADAQSLVSQKWGEFLQSHPGYEGRFYEWAGGKIPGGMDMGKFDMRVFQFERMNHQQQDAFLASMTDKGRREFLTHHRDYNQSGWLEAAKQ